MQEQLSGLLFPVGLGLGLVHLALSSVAGLHLEVPPPPEKLVPVAQTEGQLQALARPACRPRIAL